MNETNLDFFCFLMTRKEYSCKESSPFKKENKTPFEKFHYREP